VPAREADEIATDRVVDDAEAVRDERQFYQRDGGEKGDEKPDRHLPQRHRAAVLAKRPGDRQQCKHAERRLQLKHDSPEAGGDYGSGDRVSAIQTVIPDSPRKAD
jgi:hypothetical protein